MIINFPELGICGLSCRLCPRFYTEGKSRCPGCKSEYMLAVGCPFITCAIKKKGVEFCWDCREHLSCEKWKKQREFSREHDTFVSYQRLEDNISFVRQKGILEFEKQQKAREGLLRELLREFNEGRSKSYYCVAATVLDLDELKRALNAAREKSEGLAIKEKAKILRLYLEETAKRKDYKLFLRSKT